MGRTGNLDYLIGDECGNDLIVQAGSLNEALDIAKDWALNGAWESKREVSVFAVRFDTNERYGGSDPRGSEMKARKWATVEVGEDPEPPSCVGRSHDWRKPHRVVGGLRENPGVWATGGTTHTYLSVCRHCGAYKRKVEHGAQRNPGQVDTVEYLPADENSEAWVQRLNDEAESMADCATRPINE